MINQEVNKEKLNLPLSWEASRFYGKKDSNWFWYLAGVAMIVVITAIIIKNFLLAVLAVVGYFTISIVGSQGRQKHSFELDMDGIRINSKHYAFKDMESFWIDYTPPHKKELILKTKKILVGHLIIPLGDINPNKIRAILINILKEERHEESLLDIIADWLGL